PVDEIEQVKHLRGLVEETQRKLEPEPMHVKIHDTVFPTQVHPPHMNHRPLAISSIIQEGSEDRTSESEHTPFLLERMFNEGIPDPIEEYEIPSSPVPSQGPTPCKTPMNVAKLVDFMSSEVRTTIIAKLYGDPELFLALRAFLNGELRTGLPQFAQPNRPDSIMIEEENHVQSLDLDGHESVIEVPINELGQYFEGDESNATLPITTKGLTIKGILDGGAGVSIVTKDCWESMGKPRLSVTNIVVKMANGTIAKPMGMLKDLKIKVLGHKVRHTFIVMDFSKHLMSYEMILGRPFMREAQMVHDWSKNHVYLQFQDSVLRVDLVTGKVHPLGSKTIIDHRSDTTVHSAPLQYCYTCKKDTDIGQDSPYMDV
ncbi:hypothetical protein DD595_24980, partial [Enterobacter cloacae complex sp. 4DZ3-17B2]